MSFYSTDIKDDEVEKLLDDVNDLEKTLAGVFGEDIVKARSKSNQDAYYGDGSLDDEASEDDGDDEEQENAKTKKALVEIEHELDGLAKSLDALAQSSFENKVAEIAKSENVPTHIAMQKARAADFSAYQRYQESGVFAANLAKLAPAPVRTVSPFVKLARHLQISKNLGSLDALRAARAANPDLFEDYRRGE